MSTDAFSPSVFPRLHAAGLSAEREQARIRGYADGHAEGFRAASAAVAAAHAQAEDERLARAAEAERTLEQAAETLHAAARALSDRERDLTTTAQTQVLEHAIELAELILAGELADADTSAAAIIRRTMSVVDPPLVREVRVHPDDRGALERHDALPASFTFVADETLARGDAVIMLDSGHIDARVGAALERARRALKEHRA
ncbi:FliH/SctL family protein [Microbacterium sp.]|uniref:FliH/SctL family protein n=1 Tax=Microbacterium sp. TaxID=51671 RepID=UPI002736DA2F|nr:FliH/SctL family protein [Microbacterium sp.]MDP3953077.1 FliH/SctL family protein [Microbacterium sp.]